MWGDYVDQCAVLLFVDARRKFPVVTGIFWVVPGGALH
jgi:hypothetical protein